MSLRVRALLAAALLLGFYVLALGMAAGLLWIGYEAVVITKSGAALKLVIFCAVGAWLILKSIVPRRDRFEAPGPRLTAEQHPRLFACIDDAARATAQRPPADVYLLHEVNAWVAQRGGVLGVGGRRVMGIGLPLLEVLSVGELRAVVAHEFGHYVSGDTSLGPWIYRTRAAIVRTLETVAGHSGLLAKPFEWYGKAFLRVTHAVSRAQEFVADATAARVAGREPAKRALVRIAGGALAYGSYWQSELAPALASGYRPPVAAGFRQFLVAPSVAPQVAAAVDAELASEATDPYDTHPNLRDRLAALDRADGATAPGEPGDDAPALALLGDVDAAEAALVASLARGDRPLQAIAWEEVPQVVLPDGWRKTVAAAVPALAGLTPEQLPTLAREQDALFRRFARAWPRGLSAEHRAPYADTVLGAALSLALLRPSPAAPRLDAPPGEPVRFVAADGTAVHPFAVMASLRDGSLPAEAWTERCARLGLTGSDLGSGAGPALADPAPHDRHAPTR